MDNKRSALVGYKERSANQLVCLSLLCQQEEPPLHLVVLSRKFVDQLLDKIFDDIFSKFTGTDQILLVTMVHGPSKSNFVSFTKNI